VSPLEEYRARIEDRRRASQSLERLSRRIGNARLAAGLAAVALAFLVFGEVWISVWWLLIPVAAFGALVVRHARVAERLERSQRAIQFYERGVARLEDRWRGTGEMAGAGETGERFRDPGHVYAEDLDLFGKSSLFQLLSTARTRAGEDFLAKWLLAPASHDEVAARHAAVRELGGMLDLREDLAVLGATVRSGLDPDASARWGEAPEVRFPAGARSIALAFGAAILISFALYMAGVTTRTPFLAVLFLEMGYAFFLNAETSRVTQAVESPSHDLVLLAELLRRLEQETFRAPLLRQLNARLKTGSEPNASSQYSSIKIAHLGRLGERLDWAENKVFGPVAFALLWTAQVAMAIERWRRTSGRHIREWIDVAGEFEALCSLASYAYEHPADVFPELADTVGGCFEAEALGHPLMKEAHSIRNDVHLGGETRLWIVSGSNMSGKSTLLRTIGINTVLAWAGAPVRARRLRISPLTLGASIRVQDSLEDGRSRFYAEITRLREIVALTKGPRTVLFLLDELLSGTNSHDRQIGAAAIVHALIDRGALGLITTHDLALAHIADNLSGRAVNVHFADTLENGELHFDYRLQPGVVERSNALDLMRSVGLEV
jgi:MutS domain V